MSNKLETLISQKQDALAEAYEALSEARRKFNHRRDDYQDACHNEQLVETQAIWRELGDIKQEIERLENQRLKHQGDIARLQAMINQPSDLEIA